MSEIILLDKPMVTETYKKRYQPPPHKPEWFQQALTNLGGINPFGEPRLRLVWGMDEKIYRNGKLAIKYLSDDSRDLGNPMWIVEEWWSPERMGTPEAWEQSRYTRDEQGKLVDLIGEYPSRGVYWLFLALTNEDGEPSSLTESTLEYVRLMFTNRLQPATQGSNDNAIRYREMLEKQEAFDRKKEEEAQAYNNANWDEMLTKWQQSAASLTRGYSITPR